MSLSAQRPESETDVVKDMNFSEPKNHQQGPQEKQVKIACHECCMFPF